MRKRKKKEEEAEEEKNYDQQKGMISIMHPDDKRNVFHFLFHFSTLLAALFPSNKMSALPCLYYLHVIMLNE